MEIMDKIERGGRWMRVAKQVIGLARGKEFRLALEPALDVSSVRSGIWAACQKLGCKLRVSRTGETDRRGRHIVKISRV